MTTAGGDNSPDKSRVSNFSQSVAYQLFANVMGYGARYRGMQRALSEDTLEATADIVLDNDRHGTWHTPPHWIDSTFQLAGFVMNSFGVQGDGKRINGEYTPSPAATVFQTPKKSTTAPTSEVLANSQHQDQAGISQKIQSGPAAPVAAVTQQVQQPVKGGGQDQSQNPQATACLALIADETGLDLDDLTGDAAFAELGVDSLMSLALSAKIRAELGIDVQASVFLECPTVQGLVAWLSK